MTYKKFSLMMIVSFCIMYIIMFLNLDTIKHYHTSITRIYMALLMVAPMALVMLLMMGNMYPSKKVNALIMTASLVVFVTILIALRTQTPVSDVQYMKAMIPHHSSAILVSQNANLKDPEVKKLAEKIIQAQVQEIAEMKALIDKINATHK